MFNFERLDVWQKAIDFADLIYTNTRGFPADERFSLTTQLRRGAVSISSNITEGSARSSTVDFARFIEIAGGSVFEVFLSLLSRIARVSLVTVISDEFTRQRRKRAEC